MKYRLAATVMGRWIGEELDNFIYVYHEVIWNFYQGQISILTQLRSTVSVCPIHPPCHDVRIQFYCFPVVFSHPHASCLFLPVSPRLPSPVIALISFTCPCPVFFTCLCSPNCIWFILGYVFVGSHPPTVGCRLKLLESPLNLKYCIKMILKVRWRYVVCKVMLTCTKMTYDCSHNDIWVWYPRQFGWV